jgi:hypothetical protein
MDIDKDRFPNAVPPGYDEIPTPAYGRADTAFAAGRSTFASGLRASTPDVQCRRESALREDFRYERARAVDYQDAVARVRKDVANVLTYHSWDAGKQAASDAVNVHLAAAMEAVVLNVGPCRDREEAVRALSMVRMLVNRALTLGDAI